MIISGRKSSPDSRDYPYVSRRAGILNVPPPRQVDRSGSLPPAYDQGPMPTCESNAGATKLAELYPGFQASRLAIHYAGRRLENTLRQNVGIETRDLLKVLQAGVIAEAEWPYDILSIDAAPPPGSDRRMIGTYQRIATKSDLIDHLAHDGCVVLSFNVPGQFMADGTFPTVGQGWDSEGWHCVVGAGYDLDRDAVFCRNSWGPDWGIRGYFWLPFSWALDDATGADIWSATLAPPGTVAGVTLEAA